MLTNINCITEICSFLICIFIILINRHQFDNNLQYKIFKKMNYILLINLITDLLRYIIPETNTLLEFVFNNVYYITHILLYMYLVLYCISLSSLKTNVYESYQTIVHCLFGFFIITICFLPIFNIETTHNIILLLTHICTIVNVIFVGILKANASKQVKRNIFIFLILITIPFIIEIFYPTISVYNFGFTLGLLFIYEEFHCSNYDSYLGIPKDYALFDRFEKLKKDKKDFTLISIDFKNLEHFYNKLSYKEINISLSNIFRYCEKYNHCQFYSWNDKFIAFIENTDEKIIKSFFETFKHQIEELEDDKNIGKLDYNIIYFKTPNMIDNIPELQKIRSNEILEEFKLEDKIRLNYKKILLKELKDIINSENYLDERVEVFYQPILDNKTKKFLSAEALSRLNIPELNGLIYPDNYIYLLEEYNYIHRYSLIVLNKVCCFIKQLEASNIEFEGISVNFSLKEFMEDSFEDDILRIVMRNQVNPSKLHLEVTESIEAKDLGMIKDKINNLKTLGFKFYLDDFGTGYSNLSEIVEIPFDVIKFDKSLVNKTVSNDDMKFITIGISNLLSNKFEILFEGIENTEYEELAKELKISYSQGYKYSKPITETEVVQFIGKDLVSLSSLS